MARPILVEARHGQQIGDVNLVEELIGLIDQPLDQIEALAS